MEEKEILERIYNKPGAVWTNKNPPKELAELVETGKVKSCRAVDLGCGEGFYSIYMALKGFEVTGIDLSEKAISYARQNAAEAGVKIRFVNMDVTDLQKINDGFDFVLEWALMHHIMPSHRQKYVEDVSRILNNGGKYLSVCFSEKSHNFSCAGDKYRDSGKRAPGMQLYFSSLDELKELFAPHFKIIEARTIEMPSPSHEQPHTGNYLLMEKS